MWKREWSGEAAEIKPMIRVVLKRKSRESGSRRMRSEAEIGKSEAEADNSSEDSYSPMRSRLHALIVRTERIALLDSPNSSHSSEAEARHILETLHLRFSSLQPPAQSQPVPKLPARVVLKKPSLRIGLRERRGNWQGGKGWMKSSRKGKEGIGKRTVDKGAFLQVVNRQESRKEASHWLRPISAGAPLGRKLHRPATRFPY